MSDDRFFLFDVIDKYIVEASSTFEPRAHSRLCGKYVEYMDSSSYINDGWEKVY